MSCDNNRHEYFKFLSQQDDIKNALGQDAAFVLERMYQLGQSTGMVRLKRKKNDGNMEQDLAMQTELTRRLFARMQKLGIKPPTHSADGLPKNAARFGYAQIERLIAAIESGNKDAVAVALKGSPVGLSPNSRRRMTSSKASAGGAVSAIGFDAGGYYRCSNCGRFASQNYGHVCPMTASSDDLNKMLMRRLGVPDSAFRGYNMDALGSLLEEARAKGEIEMIHSLTGLRSAVTLDGIPQAMINGFIPSSWEGHAALVIANNLAVIGVLDARGMEQATEHVSAVHFLAQQYGVQIPSGSPILNAYNLLTSRSLTLQPSIQENGVALNGGQKYDLQHFIGTEFRKNDARGTFVEVGGKKYGVYARTQDARDRSSARGRYATKSNDIVIGRTLPAAIGILESGSVSEANGKIEVYDSTGNLLSVYDPATNTAGDTQGNTNASPQQMAAVLAARILNPQTAFDYALIQDFLSYRAGAGSPIAAADSGYLAIRNMLESGHVLQLGANLSVGRCSQCGQFIGQGEHACPQKKQEENFRASTASTASTTGRLDDEKYASTASAFSIEETPPSFAQIAPLSVQVSVSLPESFAEELGSAVAKALKAERSDLPSEGKKLESVLSQLSALLAAQQQSLQTSERILSESSKSGNVGNVDIEKLSESIARAVANSLPAPMTVTGGRGSGGGEKPRKKCPRCGQYMEGKDHQCPPRKERVGLQRPEVPQTEVEKILNGITMAAPDLYLEKVPPEWGGNLASPLPENVPDLNTEYEMGQQERTIYNMIALQLRKKSKKPNNRAFGLYGPAGTGKNTIARMLASSLRCDDNKQGLPYYEVNITPDMDINQAIGEVVLTTDENGQTVSRVRLGPIGVTAASGGVVAINEIVRSPKLATALQSIIEDGEVTIPTPEGGTYKIPVHPSAIFIATWNPGYEGDADRPAQAFLSRITALPLEYPDKQEQARRVRAYFEREGLEQPSEQIINAAVGFWTDLRLLTGGTGTTPQIGGLSPTRTTPGPRELSRFVEYGIHAGWDDALRTLEIICDQDPEQKETQKNILRDRFEAHFSGII